MRDSIFLVRIFLHSSRRSVSTTRAVSVALWTQDSAQHPEMMCAYRTPDQSYCKFNTNYSNNILITWGEVKNNAVIPPGAGPSPLRAGHFQLLCQSTAGFVWLWQRAHNSPKSLGSSGYSPSSIWAGSAQEKVEPNLGCLSCSLAVRPTAPLCLSTTKGGFVAGLSCNPGLPWPLHVFCILSRMITHLGKNYVIKEKMPFWRSSLKKCHFP